MLPVEGGYLANNIGRFRIFENLSEGWKPVMIESRVREVGVRGNARHAARAAPACHGREHDVQRRQRVVRRRAFRPRAVVAPSRKPWRAWKAIGQYNRFFADNAEYYRGAQSLASLAVVLDNRSEGEAILNGLAGRNVLYHVLYEHELTPDELKPYAAVALLTADMVRDRALAALEQYVAAGGKLFAAAQAATQGRERQAAASARRGSGRSTARAKRCTGSRSRRSTSWPVAPRGRPAAAGAGRAPAGVLYNVTQQPETGPTDGSPDQLPAAAGRESGRDRPRPSTSG